MVTIPRQAQGWSTHLCYVATGATASAPFLTGVAARGRARGERIVWAVDRAGTGVLARVAAAERTAQEGPDTVRVAEDLYLPTGRFEADRTLEGYRSEVRAARAAGWNGLRVLADTSWLATRPRDVEPFLAYERRVNEGFPDGGFSAVCHYDPAVLGADNAEAAAAAHPVEATTGRAEIAAGPCRVSRTAEGLRLSGEVDWSNARDVAALATDLLSGSNDRELDLTALDFIDLAGVRSLLEVARRRAGGPLVLVGGPRSLGAVLATTGWSDRPELALFERPEGAARP